MRDTHIIIKNAFTQDFINFFEKCVEPLDKLPGCDAHDIHINDPSGNCHIKIVNNNDRGFQRLQNEILYHINNTLPHFNVDVYQKLHSIQYGVYNPGSSYKIHIDTMVSDQLFNKKLTMVALLSDRSEFEGGDLKVGNGGNVVSLQKGSAVIFPSYALHSVTEVTKGTRKTMSTWILGPQWR